MDRKQIREMLREQDMKKREQSDLPQEIKLVNDIIANAVIHGGDLGGVYSSNTRGLTAAIESWLKAKGFEKDYHIIKGSYWVTPDHDDEDSMYEPNGCYPVPQIAKLTDKDEY